MSGTWRLRGYHVESLLGRGASSEVWRARVAASGDPVALKRLFLSGAEQAARAHAEAAFLTVLDHPSLVRLHAVVPADNAAVLVIDLADGGSLADLLATRGRLTPGEVVTALGPIAAALDYLHGHEVVHGDVSAANVLFTSRGAPLLADLGVARLTGDDADAESTPAYVDPAVAAGCVPGRSNDVFMLGGVALHALTGTPTWPGESIERTLAAARSGRLVDVSARLERAGVPEPMAAVVARALHIDPQFRGTASDFALDLRHSEHPVAVELSAGLARRGLTREPHVGAHRWVEPEPATHGQTTPRITRHAPIPVGAPGSGVDPDARPAPSTYDTTTDSAGDPNDHPAATAEPGRPAPTHTVRRPRPVIPRPAPRPWDRWGRAGLLTLVGGVAAVLLAVAAAVWWPSSASSGSRDASSSGSSGRVSDAREPSSDPSGDGGRPVTSRSSSAAAVAERWTHALRDLDAVRTNAFAARDVALLRRVYVPGPLLTADTATLRRIVPVGCRLVGAATRFETVRVRAGPSSALITARARLAASTLICPGRPNRRAEAIGPAHLEVRLVRTKGGMRIATQQVS